ncbi:MAG: hypothetical protein E6J53_00660 [Chloroflexi bacterium]|nr:MAG: hypothetical protein E6J53_00660 [Chloroflexota bacterium]
MSPTWKPDDSVAEGRTGLRTIRAALKKHRVNVTKRVITSRDPGMEQVLWELRREGLPPGFRSWRLPIPVENSPSFPFMTVAEPGAIVPEHSHQKDLLRVIISGSIITNGIELKSGDWMYVPAGVTYGYMAGLNPGAISFHIYW